MVGWFLHYQLPEVPDFAKRIFALLFGIMGWALSVVLDGRKLHCGGTEPLDDKTRARYKPYSVILLALLTILPVSLAKTSWGIYYPAILTTAGLLVGEIGWGSPWKALGFGLPKDEG